MGRIAQLLIAVIVLSAPAMAQPLSEKVPANAVLYFGWRGSDGMAASYADSHLKAVLDQSNIPAVFNDMIPRAAVRISRNNPHAAELFRSLTTVSRTMWKHPCAVYLADIDLTGPQPAPKGAVLCQAGDDSKALLEQLQKFVEQAHDIPIPIQAIQSGDIVALVIGYGEGQEAFANPPANPLSKDAGFAAANAKVQKDPALAAYVNFERAWALVDQAVTQNGDPELTELWPKIRDASGLTGLKRAIATAAFSGKDWMEQAYIDAPAPHSGLLTMLDNQALPDEFMKLAPADSDRVMAGSFDIARLVGIIRSAVAKVNPEAGQNVERVIGAISIYVGRDFQKEVLDPLGAQWLSYSSPTIAGRGLLGTVVINQPDDPKKAQSGLMSTQIALFNTIAPFLTRYQIMLRAQNMKTDGLSINYAAVPLISPAWCIDGKNLYISLFPQNIISAARFARGGGKSILENASFTDLRQRLGAPANITAIHYVDLSQTIGEGYQGVLALSRLVLGMGDLFGVKSPEPVIPPLEILLQHVGPSGSASWVDESGWHCKSISSFPGAALLGGGDSGGISALMQAAPALGAWGNSMEHH